MMIGYCVTTRPEYRLLIIHRTEASKTFVTATISCFDERLSAQISRVVRASAELSEHVTSDMLALFPRFLKVEPVET